MGSEGGDSYIEAKDAQGPLMGREALEAAEDLDRVRSFFDPASLGAACRASGWTVAREVGLLVVMAAEDPDPKVRLAAMDALRKRKLEALRLSGHLAEITASREATSSDGGTARITATATTITKSGQRHTEELLRAAAKGLLPVQLDGKEMGYGAADTRVTEIGPKVGVELGGSHHHGVGAAGVVGEDEKGTSPLQGSTLHRPESPGSGGVEGGSGRQIGLEELFAGDGEGPIDAEWADVGAPEDDGDDYSPNELFCPGGGDGGDGADRGRDEGGLEAPESHGDSK